MCENTTDTGEHESSEYVDKRLIEMAPVGCILFDKTFRPLLCNTMCVTMFQEESKQSLLTHLNTYLFEGVAEYQQNVLETLYLEGSFQIVATHTTASGGLLETSMTFALLRCEAEDRVVVYLVDVSEHRRVLDMYAKLAVEASLDNLTGVKNRGYFETKMSRLMTQHRQTEKPLYLLLMDIDNFKRINDTYGHVVGDEVLRRLGSVLSENIRPSDLAARYGGEEFVILLENMSMAAIKHKSEVLRKAIANMEVPLPKCCAPAAIKVTVSIGVAQYNPATMKDGETFRHCADKALYKAKYEGKNCVRIYGE